MLNDKCNLINEFPKQFFDFNTTKQFIAFTTECPIFTFSLKENIRIVALLKSCD